MTRQLLTIKSKLIQAKEKDPKLKIFGADGHKYRLNAPIKKNEITDFELKYDIKLPQEYIEFMTQIGNGGAGPYYGIYSLGDFGYMLNENNMSSPCVIDSALTKDQWEDLTEFDRDDKIDRLSSDYDRRYNSLFNGLMCIGTKGCNGQTMLILNGVDAGRIANIDQDLYFPSIAPEANFLDWYEQWLDNLLKSTKNPSSETSSGQTK